MLAVDETFRNTSPIPAVTMSSPKSHNKKKKRSRVNNDKIEAELADFKREIEEKYAKSIMNKKYIFPRTCESSISGSDRSDTWEKEHRMPTLKLLPAYNQQKRSPASPTSGFSRELPTSTITSEHGRDTMKNQRVNLSLKYSRNF